MQEGSILDGWGAWVDFSRENTLGHSLYPLAAQRQDECLLRDWQWYHQALRKFLLLGTDRYFMSSRICGQMKGKRKPIPEKRSESSGRRQKRARTSPLPAATSRHILDTLQGITLG